MQHQHRPLLVVAGWSLKNARPRVWDSESPFYLPNLRAIMVSYADFHAMPTRRRTAMEQGLHTFLAVPQHIKIYLDNGAFSFLSRTGSVPQAAYTEFVKHARPDWWPVPQDFIPTPKMPAREKWRCFQRTMRVNRAYQHDGFVPIIHIGPYLARYLTLIEDEDPHVLHTKAAVALGGIVPNLLRTPRAIPYSTILENLWHVRQTFADKQLHVFGIGGTATLHIAALLEMDSVDSSGWRSRAARGIIQLPGSGERSVADLGSWKGRVPSAEEWERLQHCSCPACQAYGVAGLQAHGIHGFCCRATHNLWILLEEARLIEEHLTTGTYTGWYSRHLDNSIYKPLIEQLVTLHPALSGLNEISRS